MGAKVVAVCRGSAKAAALKQLGADAVVDTAQHPDTPLRALIKVIIPFLLYPLHELASCCMSYPDSCNCLCTMAWNQPASFVR
jgi:hypothetical protein